MNPGRLSFVQNAQYIKNRPPSRSISSPQFMQSVMGYTTPRPANGYTLWIQRI